jgi:hypothetical protein
VEDLRLTIDSTVLEFVRHERLAWDDGVHAYHAWAFGQREGVCAYREDAPCGWRDWVRR